MSQRRSTIKLCCLLWKFVVFVQQVYYMMPLIAAKEPTSNMNPVCTEIEKQQYTGRAESDPKKLHAVPERRASLLLDLISTKSCSWVYTVNTIGGMFQLHHKLHVVTQ